MAQHFFPDIERVDYEGAETANPLAYRYYDRDRLVLGIALDAQVIVAARLSGEGRGLSMHFQQPVI